MSRQVRRVPATWQHPRRDDGSYRPLHDSSFSEDLADWRASKAAFEAEPPADSQGMTYEEWDGPEPTPGEYMPEWSDDERTHYQMYETVSEGTPLSPVMATPEELARWLVDNEADAGARQTATYEAWLRVCKGGYAPSMVITSNPDGTRTMMSGVQALCPKDESGA